MRDCVKKVVFYAIFNNHTKINTQLTIATIVNTSVSFNV